MANEKKYSVSTFRTLGQSGAAHVLFTLENPPTSLVWVRVTRVTHRPSHDGGVNPSIVSLFRTLAPPTGGTALTAGRSSSRAGAPTAVALGANASDVGSATAITATANGGAISRKTTGTVASGAGLIDDHHLDDLLAEMGEIWLSPGEAIMVGSELASTTTVRHLVGCGWEEHARGPVSS